MTSKCFAAIKSSQEDMPKINLASKELQAQLKSITDDIATIRSLAESVLHAPTTAYKAAKDINAILSQYDAADSAPATMTAALTGITETTAKWSRDFQDCDPAWKPAEKTAMQQAIEYGAYLNV